MRAQKSKQPGFRHDPSRILVGMLVLLLAGCTLRPGGTAPVVRIGLVAPFEGRYREIGYDVLYAARLAVRERNASDGIESYRVELVAFDDGGDSESAVLAARSLAVDPAVVGVIGHWLGETTRAAVPTYVQAGLPFLPMDETARDAVNVPPEFASRYQSVAPFNEKPGTYAVPAHEAMTQMIAAIDAAIAADGEPTRGGVARVLDEGIGRPE